MSAPWIEEPARWNARVGWIIAPLLLVMGLGVFLQAILGESTALRAVGWVFLLAATAEGIAGILVNRNERSGAPFMVGGVLTIFFGVYVVTRLADKPHAIAMLLALFLVMNGVFRGLELAIEHPRSWPTELLYVVTAFVLAGILFSDWKFASARLVAACVGVELIARGVALWGGARAAQETGATGPWVGRRPIMF